jgi:hypothetical protein
MEQMQVIVSFIALGLSGLVGLDHVVRRSKDDTKASLQKADEQLVLLRSFRDRIEGANALERLSKVETLQRADENALIRIEQKLQALETILTVLAEDIREMGAR